jgi:hypothetical protein
LGYSSRYHAASLAAVFLALAVGILIGAGLGDNLLADTERDLRDSLEGDIEEARGEAGDLQVQLDRERAFADQAYPALVGDTLQNRRIGVMAFGDLPRDVSSDIESALEPTGAELAEVSVVRRPAELASKDPEALGRKLGEQFVSGGGKQLDKLRDLLFERSSGEGGPLDGVILVRTPQPDDEDPEQAAETKALESGLVGGITSTDVTAVAVERSAVDESSIPFFGPFDVATVDNVDLVSGKVALVFTLLGAEGNFGIKDTANSLLPELLQPRP